MSSTKKIVFLASLGVAAAVCGSVFYNEVIGNFDEVERRFMDSRQITGNNIFEKLKGQINFSFIVCGDPHVSKDNCGYFDRIDFSGAEKNACFVIVTGDLTQGGREGNFEKFAAMINDLRGAGIGCFPAIGNHDLYNSGWARYKKKIGPSAYTVIAGNCKFIFIDTAGGRVGKKQMQWLEKELSVNTRPVVFVVSHYPIYGGSHGMYHFPRNAEREEMISLFEKYNVDCVLEGHFHGFVHINKGGVDYVTSGGIGCGLLDNDTYHYLVFTVSGSHISYEKKNISVDAPPVYRKSEPVI